MGAIRKACKGLELGRSPGIRRICQPLNNICHSTKVFVDGPHVLHPVDLVGSSTSPFSESEASGSDPALIPRAWWKSDEKRTRALGIDASLASLRDILKADRYEVSLFRPLRLASSEPSCIVKGVFGFRYIFGSL